MSGQNYILVTAKCTKSEIVYFVVTANFLATSKQHEGLT